MLTLKASSGCKTASFHPADFGILENIEQGLLPNISDELDNRLEFRKIKAELYKFTVRQSRPVFGLWLTLTTLGLFWIFRVVSQACRYSTLGKPDWIVGGSLALFI